MGNHNQRQKMGYLTLGAAPSVLVQPKNSFEHAVLYNSKITLKPEDTQSKVNKIYPCP